MVRKRSRTARKHYDSDDNDSDSDFELDNSRAQPAQKKYSLRQRKKALFIDDYDYEDDDEILPIPPTKAHSDDEDFEVEKEITSEEPNSVYAYPNQYEDPTEDPNGLIDFEDMIRADIVVNKNRIDYDNVIDKTEIKMQPNNGEPSPVKPVRSKRGRKPKKRPETEMDSSLLEPETEVQESREDKNDKEYNPHPPVEQRTEKSCPVQLNPEHTIDKECHIEKDKENTTACSEKQISRQDSQILNQEDTTEIEDQSNVNSQESVIKFNENYVHKSIHVNGTVVSANTEDSSELKDLEKSLKTEDGEEDDDVVFVEDKRAEIIVLDD